MDFFNNTIDRNNHETNNHMYSGCVVVSQVRYDGSIVFVAVAGGEVKEMVMNLKNPDVRREEASQKVVNSFLRSKSLEDPEFTQYLAGELFAGFASVALP